MVRHGKESLKGLSSDLPAHSLSVLPKVYLFPDPFYHLVASRFVIGFAAGIVSVCRAYVSHAVDVDSKYGVIAMLGRC
jgi:hypothetical protein